MDQTRELEMSKPEFRIKLNLSVGTLSTLNNYWLNKIKFIQLNCL